MKWSDLSIQEKADLMKLYVANGITSLDTMKEHYNSFATGGSLPDHDPKNHYHYHNAQGEKVVITPDDWKANVGKPYFKEIEAAVRAEQVAYPGPEYENNPDFVRDLRSVYRNNMGNNYQNYRYFASALPEGYSFTDEGLIVDPQGNYYVQSGFMQSPRFTYNSDSPLQFTINEGKPIEKTLTFYPVNMDRRVKASLPVNEIMNVAEKKRQSVKNTYSIESHILGHGFQGDEYETYPIPKGAKIVGNRLVTSDKSILENLIKNARKNRPDYNDWKINTTESQGAIPVNPAITQDGQFTHIDFSTGRPVIKQQSDFNFQIGGKLTFNEWKSQMQSKYPDIEMDNTKAGYDYVKYFNDNYDDAIKQLSKLGHFPDTYKLPNHKTFSNESIYSRGPMMGGNWINDSTFSPSVINRQQYPNIYKEDRPYTEREIYGDEYQQGGQLFQKRSYNPPSLFVTNNTSISDNTRTNAEQEVANRIAVKEAEKQVAVQNYLDRRGYLSEDKDKRSYARRDFDNNVQNIVNTTVSQAASPGNVDFNTIETGISKGLQMAMLPELTHQALVRPIATTLGLSGTVGSNMAINSMTPYSSFGNMIGKGLFDSNDKRLTGVFDLLNPFGFIGGIYGNGVENRVGELLIRRGDSLKNGASTAKNLFKHMFPDVSDYVKEITGFKHPVLRYALDPRQRDLVYRFSNLPKEIKLKPNFSAFPYGYSGNNVDIPFKGDIVDIFFNKKLNNTGFNYVRETPTFFETYMQQNYPYKKPYWFRIGEASAGTPSTRLPNKGWRTDNTEAVAIFPDDSEKSFIDPGGFRVLEEKPEITHFADIWKYNGKDALKRYYVHDLSYTPIGQKPTLQSKLYKPIIQYFGDYIDAHSTPIITQWYDTRPLFQSGGSLGKITPLGQWEYPHQITTIPSNNITMKGVNYPVIGISNTGDTKYMLPNMDYLFDGQYVTEYPIN